MSVLKRSLIKIIPTLSHDRSLGYTHFLLLMTLLFLVGIVNNCDAAQLYKNQFNQKCYALQVSYSKFESIAWWNLQSYVYDELLTDRRFMLNTVRGQMYLMNQPVAYRMQVIFRFWDGGNWVASVDDIPWRGQWATTNVKDQLVSYADSISPMDEYPNGPPDDCGVPCVSEKTVKATECGGEDNVDWATWNNETCTGGQCTTKKENSYGPPCGPGECCQ